jgi:hypothetical protein
MSSISTTKINTSLEISGETKITDLPFCHHSMIIEQAFSFLCWQSGNLPANRLPETVKDLSQAVKLPIDDVIGRLTEICRLSNGLVIESTRISELSKPFFIHLDSTSLSTYAENQRLPLEKVDTFIKQIALQRQEACVIVVGKNIQDRYSAALALREKGIQNAYALDTV